MGKNPPDNSQTDPDFLKEQAYGDPAGLETRLEIQDEHSTGSERWYRWAFERLDLPEVGRLLELGCGTGRLWEQNRERLPSGGEHSTPAPALQALLADLSEGMVRKACRRLAGTPGLEWGVCDALALPTPGRAFDAVIAYGLLDHIPERGPALDEIRRVLKPGGALYASAGGKCHLGELEDLLRPFLPGVSLGGAPERFGLENGARLLSPWFCDITLDRFDDDLVFEDPDPLMAYLLSEAVTRNELGPRGREVLRRSVVERLSGDGPLKVRLEKGLFTARRPRDR
jgi:SAM-dependent methyltransferase